MNRRFLAVFVGIYAIALTIARWAEDITGFDLGPFRALWACAVAGILARSTHRWLTRPEPAQLIEAAAAMTAEQAAEFRTRWEQAHAPCTCDQCDVMGCRHGECQDCPRHATRRSTR